MHRDLVLSESKELLAKLVIMFLVPFPLQEIDNGFSASEEPLAISPDAIFCVRFADELGVAGGQASVLVTW